MKYLESYASFKEDDIRKFLNTALKDELIDIKVPIDEIVNKFKRPEIGSFEYFVLGLFISHAVLYNKNEEFIKRFKELGLDTSKLEELLPYVRKHQKLFNELESAEMYIEKEKDIENLRKEEDEMYEYVEKYKEELKRLGELARNILY